MATESLRKSYLLFYNLVQTVGWATALWRIVAARYATGSLASAHAAAGDTVGARATAQPPRLRRACARAPVPAAARPRLPAARRPPPASAAAFQLLAALEVAHAASGLVRGAPALAALQWAGRTNALCGVVRAVPAAQPSLAVGAMLGAWALSEVVRYPWYAAGVAGAVPYWLTWLRYSLFVPLYPIGVAGEMAAVFAALPEVRRRRLASVSLPNAWNFAFDYGTFLSFLLVIYLPVWWSLYSAMLRQRRARLGPGLGRLGPGGGGGARPRAVDPKRD
jgi:very-long-chain (3R)-3-hydroxyacyl-CoA dehydratase